ncbi:hypothetical protein BC835DRAFT_1413545 [Cytidiella melzeri]|nr:hypothetical protein BC835DRAFT_1413545 [Cytidiella melzeri]
MDIDSHGLYQDVGGQSICFTAGEDLEQISAQVLHQQIEDLGYYSHECLADFWSSSEGAEGLFDGEDATLSNVATALEAMGKFFACRALGLQLIYCSQSDLDEDEDEEILTEQWEARHNNQKWAPYLTKTMFMLDFLDSLPRLRLSDDHLKTIMWVMKECGTPDVPSFSALRKRQSELTAEMGLDTNRRVSTFGNEFYNNSAAQMFHLDWANPLVRPHIRPYVEVSSTVSEFYQAERLQNTDVDLLQLMWADFKNAPGSTSTSRSDTIQATELIDNVLDLKNQGLKICFDDTAPQWTKHMPHPVRLKAQGRPTFTVGLMSWADDVSGNRSKQYNAHTNVYAANLNLPHCKLQQEYFVRFSSTSPTATALEQLDGFLEDIGPDRWHEAYDCLLKQEILFRLILRVDPADNPQQSELCSHIGLNGNKFCRKCHVGGPAKEMETHVGYHSLYEEGTARTAGDTVTEIVSQMVTAMHGNEQNVEAMQTASGIKDPIAQFWIQQLIQKARDLHHKHISSADTQDSRLKNRKLKGEARQAVKNKIAGKIEEELMRWLTEQPAHRYSKIPEDSPLRTQIRPGDHYNKLLVLEGHDVHRDTTVELLHTYLLGLDKYVWHTSHTAWSDAQRQIMAIRLQGSSVDGLSIFPVRGQYLVKYRNNLIGKHFKTLQQVGVFHLHPDLLEIEYGTVLLELWKATGELGALLFYHEIDNMSTYLEDLDTLIGNLLDVWGTIDPNRILNKPKIHLLKHIITDIRNSGPAILFSTEIFECWNSIFRMCSVLSNHHAPSHDIAAAIADLERFKHQVSGGWWKTGHGSYVRAGDGVREMFQQNSEIQRRLGWADPKPLSPGTVRRATMKKRMVVSWEVSCVEEETRITADACTLSNPSCRPADALWEYAQSLVSRSADVCKEGSWVFYERPHEAVNEDCNRAEPPERLTFAGRIRRILIPSSDPRSENGLVQVERFAISGQPDARLNMPVLHRECSLILIDIVPVKNIAFIFNAQHDCLTAECTTHDENVHQERRITGLTQKGVRHGEMQRYFINMHALHNAALIRRTLPRHFSKPNPFYIDRVAKHQEFSDKVSSVNTKRRDAAVAKARDTRARKKEAQELQVS